MDVSRRAALTGIAATGVLAGSSANAMSADETASGARDLTANGKFNPPLEARRPLEIKGLLLNQERAQSIMEQEGVDLLICARAENYYYLTGHTPGALLLGYDAGIDFATLSAHGDLKPTMITSQIGLYFQGTTRSQLDLMNVEIVGLPADFAEFASLTEPAAIANAPGAPFLTRRHDRDLESVSERYRHALVARESEDLSLIHI